MKDNKCYPDSHLPGSERLRLPRGSAEACSKTASPSFKAVKATRDGVRMEFGNDLRAPDKTDVGLTSQ